MADANAIEDTPELRARWGNFAWTAENAAKAATIRARYPEGRQMSCTIPYLDLAQRQRIADVQHQREVDDLRGIVEITKRIFHPQRLRTGSVGLKPV